MSRWDSAAMVPKTSELLPEPDTPVNTVRRRLGSSTLMSLRLFTRAPCTRIRSWLSATCGSADRAADRAPALVAMLIQVSVGVWVGRNCPQQRLRSGDLVGPTGAPARTGPGPAGPAGPGGAALTCPG